MKLYELVDTYHRNTDLSCAEAMLRACDEYFHLNLDIQSRKMFSTMGVGMQTGQSCCGAFTVAVGVIGLLTAREGELNCQNARGALLVQSLTEYMLGYLGSLQCAQLRELRIHGFDNPCDAIVPEIAAKLESLLGGEDAPVCSLPPVDGRTLPQ